MGHCKWFVASSRWLGVVVGFFLGASGVFMDGLWVIKYGNC